MITVGLTGSIGMGKSTAAKIFADEGIAVYDADATVHELYKTHAVPLIKIAFPGTVIDDRVDRSLLGKRVLGKREAMTRLEAIIHPLVREKERQFLDKVRNDGHDLAILDIPLLFETGEVERFDKVIVVTTSLKEQKSRVLQRPSMTEEKFNQMMDNQISNSKKCQHADFILDTSSGLEDLRSQIQCIIKTLRTDCV